jgi:hypothetical protein
MNTMLIGLADPEMAEAARLPGRPRYSFNPWLMSCKDYTLIAYPCKQIYQLHSQSFDR